MRLLLLLFLASPFAYGEPMPDGGGTGHDHMNEDKHLEHMLILNLTREDIATVKSVKSGRWDDSNTWGGVLPKQGDRVFIKEGDTVLVDKEIDPSFMFIRVNGKLEFSTTVNTQLKVDTLVVDPLGTLEVGTRLKPVAHNITAKIIIDDLNNGIETQNKQSLDYDPFQFGQGLIVLGTAHMAGVKKTAFVTISAGSNEPKKGDVRLHLDNRPSDWSIGDTLIIGGTGFNGEDYGKADFFGEEVRKIINIESGVIILDRALEKNHLLPKHTKSGLTLKVYVANITRNVIVETAEDKRMYPLDAQGFRCDFQKYAGGPWYIKFSTESFQEACRLAEEQCKSSGSNDCHRLTKSGQYDSKGRGHIMFMHTNNVDLNYVGLYHLGRSRKVGLQIDDTSSDENGNITHIGTNPRARYSLHFHRAGAVGNPGLVNGCVATYSPGWGYVNHGSFVHFTNNVAYEIAAASFTTERADERGSFIGNISIKNIGDGGAGFQKSGSGISNYGTGGHGFWLHSPLTEVRDNVVLQSASSAYAFYPRAIDHVSTIPYEYIPPKFRKNYVEGDNTNRPKDLILNTFSDNVVYASNVALGIDRYIPYDGSVFEYGEFNNTLAVMTNRLILTKYNSNGIKINNLVGINNLDSPFGVGADVDVRPKRWVFSGLHIEGFLWGARPSRHGIDISIKDSYFNAVIGVIFDRKSPHGAVLAKFENVNFGKLSKSALDKGLARISNLKFPHYTKFKGGSLQTSDIKIDKQYDYLFINIMDRNVSGKQHAPGGFLLPSSIYIAKDDEVYEVYYKREQHPDFIPFPSEYVNSSSSKWDSSILPDFFKDKTNEELVAYSKANKEKITNWHKGLKATFWSGLRYSNSLTETYNKIWPDKEWAMAGGKLLPRDWKTNSKWIDGEDRNMYNAVLIKVDGTGFFNSKLITNNDVLDLTSSDWEKNSDGSYTISTSKFLELVKSNDNYTGKDDLVLDSLYAKTNNGGIFRLYELYDKSGTLARRGINATYFPPQDFKGQDSFELGFVEKEIRKLKSKFKVTLTTDPIKSDFKLPIAQNDSLSIKSGETKIVNVLSNDSHPDGESLTLETIEDIYFGSAEVLDNKVSYTAPFNFTGKINLGYIVASSDGGKARGKLNISVTGGSDYGKPPEEELPEPEPPKPPVEDPRVLQANDLVAYIIWNKKKRKNKVIVRPTKNDVGKRLRITNVSQPTHGTVEIKGKRHKSVLYRLTNQNLDGEDTFTYTVEDKFGNTDSATVRIIIDGNTSLPIDFPEPAPDLKANPDNIVVSIKDARRGKVFILSPLVNDQGDGLKITSAKGSNKARIIINKRKNKIRFILKREHLALRGVETLEYTITDKDGKTSTTSINLTITD